MPRIFVLIGPPGSGKSTWVGRYFSGMDPSFPLAAEPIEVLSSDAMIEAFAKERGLSYRDAIALVDHEHIRKTLLERLRVAIEKGYTVILDRTNMTIQARNTFLAAVPDYYDRIAVDFRIHPALLIERLAKRERDANKHIPIGVFDRFVASYEAPTTDVIPMHRWFARRPEFTRVVTMTGTQPSLWRRIKYRVALIARRIKRRKP